MRPMCSLRRAEGGLVSRLDGAPEAWAPSHRVALVVARAGRDELGHQASVRLLVAVRLLVGERPFRARWVERQVVDVVEYTSSGK